MRISKDEAAKKAVVVEEFFNANPEAPVKDLQAHLKAIGQKTINPKTAYAIRAKVRAAKTPIVVVEG